MNVGVALWRHEDVFPACLMNREGFTSVVDDVSREAGGAGALM